MVAKIYSRLFSFIRSFKYYDVRKTNTQELGDYFKGRISYLKNMESNVYILNVKKDS